MKKYTCYSLTCQVEAGVFSGQYGTYTSYNSITLQVL